MGTSVFDREGEPEGREISGSFYNVIIGLTLLWGFGVNWWMVTNIDPAAVIDVNVWIFLGAYFASAFLGIYLFNASSNPVVSFAGYNLVVLPFGFVLNIVVNPYLAQDSTLVTDAIRVTGLVTLVMMVLGTMYPAFFQKISGALFLALVAVIIIEVVEIFIFGMHHDILDWVVVGIFCGYIGYDWGRANRIPKTIDNAVDSAAALYMDIINLFIRILRIMGRR